MRLVHPVESGRVIRSSIISGGRTTWQVIDLPAGHYAAFCMVPMNWDGLPHAFMGMIKVFDIK